MKIYQAQVGQFFTQEVSLEEILLKITPFPIELLRQVVLKGAVYVRFKGKGKTLRVRKLGQILGPNDRVTFFYDPKVLSLPSLDFAHSIYEDNNYGVWIKPSGIVSQGTQAGDHASLLRYVEKKKKKEVFLVHRLDRETSGLMIIAYHSKAAAFFSREFSQNNIIKWYLAIVLGELTPGSHETIKIPLDAKVATTHFEVLETRDSQSLLRVKIDTGRFHQIRRHLYLRGFPVIGDPKYGRNNKNHQGLQLQAFSVEFYDPWLKRKQSFLMPDQLTLKNH